MCGTKARLIKNAGDLRLDPVFKGPAAFRSASFRPHEEAVPVEKRVELAKRLTAVVGSKVNLTTDELARTTREIFSPDGAAAEKVRATLVGLGIPVPTAVTTVADAVRDLAEGNDDGAVLTALAVWDDLLAGRKTVADLATLLNSHVHDLRAAQEVVASPSAGLPAELATQHAELPRPSRRWRPRRQARPHHRHRVGHHCPRAARLAELRAVAHRPRRRREHRHPRSVPERPFRRHGRDAGPFRSARPCQR